MSTHGYVSWDDLSATKAIKRDLDHALSRLSRAEARVARLEQALQHSTQRNHEHSPDSCSGCDEAHAALAESAAPAEGER